MRTNEDSGPLGERLLALLDEGVAPVTAEEARIRSISDPGRHLSVRPNPRRNRLFLMVGFAILLAVGAFAIVTVSGPRRGHAPTVGGGQVFVVDLAPEVHATTQQLDKASEVVLQRLRLIGEQGAHATVSGNTIVLTTSGDAQQFQSMLPLILSPGDVLFRPVLCAVPFYRPGSTNPTRPLPTACPTKYQLSAANLNINTNTGLPQNSVPAWPALASYPSTLSANDGPSRTVLLSADGSSGFAGERLLLGPSQLGDLDVLSARAAFLPSIWTVDVTLNPGGANNWDALANKQFHAYIAIDFDGTVVSAPLAMPNQSTFSNFDGKIQVSGGFTKTTAENLAADLESGPLPVPLRPESS
jgi:hypothetical protein